MFGLTQRIFKIFLLSLLSVFFYFIVRLEFLFWNWHQFQDKTTADILWALLIGLRFDLFSSLTLNAPLIILAFLPWPNKWELLWRKGTWLLYIFLQVPFFILNFIDTGFFNFVGRRFTADTLFVMGEVQGKVLGFLETHWPLFIIGTIILAVLIWLSGIIINAPNCGQTRILEGKKAKAIYYTRQSATVLCTMAITLIGIRGGLQGKPINFVSANIFTAPLLNNLVLNSTFTLIKSYGMSEIKQQLYFQDKEIMLGLLNGSLNSPLNGSLLDSAESSNIGSRRPKTPQNVVVLILESFGSEYVGPHGGITYTPFLDSLMAKSLVFKNSYANGRRSIEGIAAIMAGIPNLMSEPFISSHFVSNFFLGLGTILAEQKYSTAFYHGGHNGTMYFDSFMQNAGIENYYGSQEYGNSADDDGIWGIWDEPYLQYALRKMDQMQAPMMSAVFTLSSHHPFRVPDQYLGQFSSGPIEILKTVAYTDMALKKFFLEAEKKPWFQNTLFVITADHTSQHYLPEYTNEVGNYRIPIFFYHPSFQFPQIDPEMVVQQIDILPSILDFLGIQTQEKIYMGSSIFTPGDKVAINYIDNRYILFAKDYHIYWAPDHGEPVMFSSRDIKEESPLTEPHERKEILVEKLKAGIQYYNDGMINNRLYYPNREK